MYMTLCCTIACLWQPSFGVEVPQSWSGCGSYRAVVSLTIEEQPPGLFNTAVDNVIYNDIDVCNINNLTADFFFGLLLRC